MDVNPSGGCVRRQLVASLSSKDTISVKEEKEINEKESWELLRCDCELECIVLLCGVVR